MEVRQLSEQRPFTTKDGSTIRSILDLSNAPVIQQSLAEATIAKGNATDRHYHKVSEEFYFLLEGEGVFGQDRMIGVFGQDRIRTAQSPEE